MKVIVCGGREYHDRKHIYETLDRIHSEKGFKLIINGGARGTDLYAVHWAERKGIPVITIPAEWSRYGNFAGHIRNQKMLEKEKPDMVIAFPGGSGTSDMVDRAKRAGVETMIIEGANNLD